MSETRYSSWEEFFSKGAKKCCTLFTCVGNEGLGSFEPREIYRCDKCGQTINVPHS